MTEQTPAKPKVTRLRVVTPWCTAFTFPLSEEDTLVVDQHGIEVSAKDAQALIQTAAQHGVTITEVSDNK